LIVKAVLSKGWGMRDLKKTPREPEEESEVEAFHEMSY
jgi:hypothetical protein